MGVENHDYVPQEGLDEKNSGITLVDGKLCNKDGQPLTEGEIEVLELKLNGQTEHTDSLKPGDYTIWDGEVSQVTGLTTNDKNAAARAKKVEGQELEDLLKRIQ